MMGVRTLGDDAIHDIAKALILAPQKMENDERYQRIREQAPTDFKAIQNQVHRMLVIDECADFGGIARLLDESLAWMLKRVDDLSFNIKKQILERGLKTKNVSLVDLALGRLSEIELSQHTKSIEKLAHEVLKQNFCDQTNEMARSIRDKASEASPLSLHDWQEVAKMKG